MSTMDVFIRFVIDKLQFILHSKDYEEMRKRTQQAIVFFRSCLKNQEIVLAPIDYKKLKEKK